MQAETLSFFFLQPGFGLRIMVTTLYIYLSLDELMTVFECCKL